jgi:methylmalonyl-CoA mutase cobalamin-binding subunit
MGVKAVYGPGTPTTKVIDDLKAACGAA